MCKLCGHLDRTPVSFHRLRKPESIEFQKAVKDYIGTYSCTTVNFNYLCMLRNNTKRTIDQHILATLYSTYYLKKLSKEERKAHRQAQVVQNTQINTTSKSVCGIKIVTNHKTNHTYYEPFINTVKRKLNLPVKYSFEEALQAKIEYMVSNGHTNGLTILQTKLKELQNESKQNIA